VTVAFAAIAADLVIKLAVSVRLPMSNMRREMRMVSSDGSVM
jgi:hypothetical protein